ncbi:MAG: Ku protein [Candidatus Pristimantibacillus lignocellulolyticus]|uniref:Non-homologous end joining protein Ku n=1 Tax=Candidatus Pristimantibacillus lignocellulolyticus TaxID=2994561 RepID=A0A9J6ZDF6_9BACL|nr:MAG: Ku protein [Candidatus Pristimantibacillus lignocellulolyticus]
MHTVWKGAISFGLVHVPVKMHSATEDKDIHFRQLHKECGMPIAYEKKCPHCSKDVLAEDIVKGFEYDKDKFVIVNETELESIKPESARIIKILDFVELTDIDPIYYEKPYYLSPDMTGAGAYNLLMEAIKRTGKIGIAKISIRSKSNLAAIRVVDNCLCLETMHFPDEIRAINQVPNLPQAVEVNDKELQMAITLVEQLSEKFDASKYTDEYRVALTELIEQKIAGESIDVINAPSATKSNVIDLMAALQASLEVTKPQPPTPSPKRKKRTKKENVS